MPVHSWPFVSLMSSVREDGFFWYSSHFLLLKSKGYHYLCSSFRSLSLSGKKISKRIVVVLVKGCVNEWVEEWVWVTQPEKDTFPERGDVTWTERNDELSKEKGNPAEHKYTNQDAHHQSRSPLFLLSPRLAIRLERYSCVTNCEGHLWLPFCLLYLAVNKLKDVLELY